MSDEDRDTYGIYKGNHGNGLEPQVMGAETLIRNDVYNHKDKDLGDSKEVMLDMSSGKMAYAVSSFGGSSVCVQSFSRGRGTR